MQLWPDLVHHCLLQTQHGRADGGRLNDDQGFRLVTLPSALGTIETWRNMGAENARKIICVH
jgi:hypothetical protein